MPERKPTAGDYTGQLHGGFTGKWDPGDPGRIVEFDPENRGDPGRPRVFTRHGLWVCVAHFKSKEPESKRPRICLEEGRAATFGSVWADETKGRLALPGVKVASSSYQDGGPNSYPTRCSKGTSRAVDRKRPVPSPRPAHRGGRRTRTRSSLYRINVVVNTRCERPFNRCRVTGARRNHGRWRSCSNT